MRHKLKQKPFPFRVFLFRSVSNYLAPGGASRHPASSASAMTAPHSSRESVGMAS